MSEATTQQTKAVFYNNLRATWDLFYHESGCLEVRALLKTHATSKAWEGRGDTITGYFNNFDAFSKAVTDLDAEKNVKGVYITLNPCLSALMGRANNRLLVAAKGTSTGDMDIVSRKAILIDCDPFRPAEIASTDEEMAASIAKRDEVAAFLYGQGFPEMWCANSGNGAHLIGRVDMPNTDESKKTVNDFLEFLNWKFGTVPADIAEAKRQFAAGVINVGIDCTVFNAARITKLYGPVARKGDNTTDRPHRRAKFTFIPEESSVIPADLLERFAQEWRAHKAELASQAKPPASTNGHKQAFSTNGHKPAPVDAWSQSADGVERWFNEHGIALGERSSYTGDGFQYKWDVDCLTCAGAHTDGAVVLWGADKGLGYKCHHNGCKGKGWADVRSLIAPKVYTNGSSKPKAASPNAANVSGIIQQIDAIAADASIENKLAAITSELAGAIGLAERSSLALIAEALIKAGLTKTSANAFIRDCVADRKVEKRQYAKEKGQQEREAELSQRQAIGLATINVEGQLSDVIKATMTEICRHNKHDQKVFVRGGSLVRIVKDENKFDCIEELSQSALLGYVADVAIWERVTKDKYGADEVKEVYPPRDVVSTVLAAGSWPGIPALTGIVMSPVFTKTGELHKDPGYNPSSRLFYVGGVTVGDTTPTAERVAWAKDLILNNILIDFPFKDEAGRAHAVGYMLLPFVRSMIDGPTPVHAVDAPTAGTGKGKLLNACAFPFLGHDVSTMAAAKDDDEWRKRITTSLMSGNTHLVIDNINHELDSGSLASAFTQPIWEDRTLGSNREIKIPVRTVWAMTGNNIAMSQELARRSVWIRLDSNMEKPWQTTGFKHADLMGWVRDNRDALATAAITLVQAWIDKGMPAPSARPKGSYEAWAKVIGGILETVGIPGFLANEEELYDTVVSTSNLMADFVAEWWDKYKLTDVPTNDLFKLASYSDDNVENQVGDWKNLLSNMLTSQKQRGRQTQLGNILNSNRDKIVAGYKIKYAKAQRGMAYWRLEMPKVVEPQTEVLPHKMSNGIPTTGSADQKAVVVEPGRTFPGGNHITREIFSCPSDQAKSEQEKNNNLYSAQGKKVLPGSTTNGATSGKVGQKVVEPQIEVLPLSQKDDEAELIGFDENGAEVWSWKL